MIRKKFYFDDVFADMLLVHTLNHATFKGAEIAAAVEAAPNPASRHRVFAPEDGTLLYRQLDNFSLKHRVMFDWLDEVLDQRLTRPAAPARERRTE